MTFNAVHRIDPKYQQQVLNEIQCDDCWWADEGGNKALSYAGGYFIFRVHAFAFTPILTNAFWPLASHTHLKYGRLMLRLHFV